MIRHHSRFLFLAAIVLLIVLVALPQAAPAAELAVSADEFSYLPAVRTYAGLAYVPAGEFEMGCDPLNNASYNCRANEQPLHTVFVDAFSIYQTEVTNQDYARCVAASACSPPAFNSSETRASYYDNPQFANYPVIYVSWNDATNYCSWAGGRLPTEAEWEKAARGTTPRGFPWGNQPATCSLSNGSGCVGDTVEVGSLPGNASPYGVYDMSGNVWEWINDWFDENYYSSSPTANPTGPATGTVRVFRGGNWEDSWELQRTAFRGFNFPLSIDNTIGFRCVFDLN